MVKIIAYRHGMEVLGKERAKASITYTKLKKINVYHDLHQSDETITDV